MVDELIDVIDENNQVIRQELKSVIHQQGLRHRVSAVLVENEEGKILVTTAADYKPEAGNYFHSAAGHVTASVGYLETAIRELEEETGLKVNKSDLTFIGYYWFEKQYPDRKEHERFQVYKLKYSPHMGKIIPNQEHYNEQWFSREELQDIMSNNPDKLSTPLRLTCEKLLKL